MALSQFISPLGTAVQVRLARICVPLVAPVDYSSSNPFMVGGLAPARLQSLTQSMAFLTLTSTPQPATRRFLTMGEGWG